MKKMIIILLLLFLASCVSALKHFIYVNVTQMSYQAEENQNITLEWTFSTRRDTSLRSISTFCYLYTEDRTSVLFHLNEGVESPESQDPQFAGRLQWDKDVLTEGRLTLHVSRLRTSDSGFYQCDILVIPDGSNSNRCSLNVTEAKPNSTLKTELQTPDPNQETDVKVGQPPLRALVLSVCIVLVMVVVGFGVTHFLLKRCVREKETKVVSFDETNSCFAAQSGFEEGI